MLHWLLVDDKLLGYWQPGTYCKLYVLGEIGSVWVFPFPFVVPCIHVWLVMMGVIIVTINSQSSARGSWVVLLVFCFPG